MEETYFPEDIWGEIKSFLLPPPLPKYPHPHSLLIKSLSTIYTIDSPKENILYGYCMSCGTQTGWYFCKSDTFNRCHYNDCSFICYKCRIIERKLTSSFF